MKMAMSYKAAMESSIEERVRVKSTPGRRLHSCNSLLIMQARKEQLSNWYYETRRRLKLCLEETPQH